MALETDNIIIGAARFWVGAPDAVTAAPTLTVGTTAPTLTGWTEVGFTSEGVEVSYEPDYADVEVDQLLDSAVIFKQGMRVTVNTTLAEASLENLLVIWGQRDSGDTDSLVTDPNTAPHRRLTIQSGALGDFPVERSLLFQGPAPRGGATASTYTQRWYHLRRAIQTESSSFALRRAEATTLPASFRCLPTEDGEYGEIIDRARAAGA